MYRIATRPLVLLACLALGATACSGSAVVGEVHADADVSSAPTASITDLVGDHEAEENPAQLDDGTTAEVIDSAESMQGPELSRADAVEAELLEFGFELSAAVVADRAPEPVEAVDLIDPVLVDADGVAAFSFGSNDRTEVLIVPGSEPSDPTAFAMVLDPESVTSFQTIITSSMLLEESDLITLLTFNLTLEGGPSERPLAGVAHVAQFTRAETTRQGFEWIVTIVPDDTLLTPSDLAEAVLASARARWVGIPEASAIEREGDGAVSTSHIPLELGSLHFGMTIDEFVAVTGDDLSSSKSRPDRTSISQEFADGDLEAVTYYFREPDDVLYEVILDYRLSAPQVRDLALEMFGPIDPDMPDMQPRATGILRFGEEDEEWLLPTPDGREAWAWRNDQKIVVVSTMADTEFGFVPAAEVPEVSQVLVVVSDIPPGTPADSLLGVLTVRSVPSGFVAADAISTIEDLQALTGYVTTIALLPGDQLRLSHLQPG